MRKLFVVGFLLIVYQVFGQELPAKYLVQFSDKANAPYSLNAPEEFLTQRALDRRARFGIAVDSTDIPIDPAYIQAVQNTGASIVIQVKWLNSILIETDSQTVLDAISDLPFVTTTSVVNKRANASLKKDKFELESVSLPFKAEEATDPTYGEAYNQIDMVNGIALHKQGYKGEGMVIAVLDAGFIYTDQRAIFDALWNNNQILGTYNFVDPSASVFASHSHGTMVLSVMGGNLAGSFLGTAPNAKYWLLRTEDSGSEYPIEEYNWIAGAAFADSVGVDIINSSLGYYEFDDAAYDYSWTDMTGNTAVVTNGADLAAAKGILVVNSAGNEGNDSWHYIIAPADADSVLAVGAVDPYGVITSFSSYGLESDSRVKPNIVAQGGSTVVANEYSDDVKTANGTSFSSPLIAGMMACLWQANPTATNMELIQAVEESASQYNNPDNRYGYGIPDFYNASLSLATFDRILNADNVRIFPNPVTDKALIQWNSMESNYYQIEVLDIQGRVVVFENLLGNDGKTEISLKDLHSGLYFVRLTGKTSQTTSKLLKSH